MKRTTLKQDVSDLKHQIKTDVREFIEKNPDFLPVIEISVVEEFAEISNGRKYRIGEPKVEVRVLLDIDEENNDDEKDA